MRVGKTTSGSYCDKVLSSKTMFARRNCVCYIVAHASAAIEQSEIILRITGHADGFW